MRLFRKDFLRNVDDSIQMADISKRNSFSETTGYKYVTCLTVKASLMFDFSDADIYIHATCEEPTESMTVIPANIQKTFSPHAK